MMAETPPQGPAPSATSSLDRAVSVEVIRASGGYAVEVPRGSKKPMPDWDPRKASDARSAQTLSSIEFSDSNIGLHVFGPLIDIDVNSRSAAHHHALAALLPRSNHVWGTRERSGTHRLYLLDEESFEPADWGILRLLREIPEAHVVIRGGRQARGEYILMPGSEHPTDGAYTWEALGEAREPIAATSLAGIMAAVRLAGAVAVVADKWEATPPEEMVMALTAFLHRAHGLAADLGEHCFVVDRDDAGRFFDTIFSATGTDPVTARGLRELFSDVWSRLTIELELPEATPLNLLVDDEEFMAKIYTLLTDNPEVRAIDEWVNRFVIVRPMSCAVDLEQLGRGSTTCFYKRAGLKDSFGDQIVSIQAKGKAQKLLLPDLMWSLPATRRFDGLTFSPGKGRFVHEREGLMVNTFTGFAIEPHPEPVTAADVKPFLEYVYELMCRKDKALYGWVMSWAASIFSAPDRKPGTALVAVGDHGVGKSFFGEQIIGKIIGDAHFGVIDSVDQLTGQFTASLTSQLMIMCEEATHSGQNRDNERLKALITAVRQKHEPKGIDRTMVPHHCRYYFTSNNLTDALRLAAGNKDRRFTVVEFSSDQRQNNRGYWRPFAEWLQEPGVLAKIHRYLKDFEFDHSLIMTPIMTEAKERIQQHSMPVVDAWLAHCLEVGHMLPEEVHTRWPDAPIEEAGGWSKIINRSEWAEWHSPGKLHESYVSFARSRREKAPLMPAGLLVRTLKEMGLYPRETNEDNSRRLLYTYADDRSGRVRKSRISIVKSMSREKIEAYLSELYGYEAAVGAARSGDTETASEFDGAWDA